MSESTGRIIKRYANRKLYDTQESRYVTLEQIAEMIRQGEEVRVVDNTSKDDLTSVTLAQIIFEEEKKRRSFLPLSALRNIIQSGGESLQELMSQISEAGERVGRMFQSEDASPEADGEATEDEADEARPAPAASETNKLLRDLMDGLHGAVDEWQNRLEHNIQQALNSVSPLSPLNKEVSSLRERIAELERKLSQVEREEE